MGYRLADELSAGVAFGTRNAGSVHINPVAAA